MAKTKLDKDGFILPLAIGALALLLFAYYFFMLNNKSTIEEKPIESVEELDTSMKTVDKENPDTFNADLNINTSDALSF